MYKREGGLKLCDCGHAMAFHPTRHAWAFHEGSSEAGKSAPLVTACSFCDCNDPQEASDQSFNFKQSAHSLKS